MRMLEKLNVKGDGFDWFALDRIDAVWWGLAFIWGALILLSENIGWAAAAGWWYGWGVFFAGAGVFALICAVARLQMPAYRAKWTFSAIFGVIFLAIGLSAWEAGWWIWFVVLASIGAVTLLSAFRKNP